MKPKPFFPDANPKTAQAQKPTASADLIPGKPDSIPTQVARRAYAIYEQQGSQPGHEVKHWLEAEAQLIGGVERKTQMHPSSPLFITEH
jgi:hypothetical protein